MLSTLIRQRRGRWAPPVERTGPLALRPPYVRSFTISCHLAIVDTVRESLLVLSPDLTVQSANHSFYKLFQVTPEETKNRKLFELGSGQWHIPELRLLLEELLPHKKTVQDFEVDVSFPKIGRKVMLLNARQLDHVPLILLAMEDISDRRIP